MPKAHANDDSIPGPGGQPLPVPTLILAEILSVERERLGITPAEGAFLFPALSAYWPDYCTAVVAQARRAHRTEALAKAAAGRALLKHPDGASFADMSPAEQAAYVAGMRAMARIISAGWDYHRKVESATQIDGEFQAQIDEIVEQGLLSE